MGILNYLIEKVSLGYGTIGNADFGLGVYEKLDKGLHGFYYFLREEYVKSFLRLL